ncbi:MAG TPA: ABC transporter substrate-binding protein [Kofleriaceae bacterium]|nr:ABC transporter substrate-binding protein [Kofleriaceae bacterium]
MGRYVLVLAVLGACSTHYTSKPCTTDNECGSDVCELREGSAVCVNPSEATINLGQSAPFSGINAALGTDMNAGIMLAINEQNAAGGIHGRQLAINALDDGYDPTQAQANAMRLTAAVDTGSMPTNCPNTPTPVSNGASPPVLVPVSTTALDRGTTGVLALIGSVGTPTAVRATPVATETHTLFYGAFTGATTPLRDMTAGACQKYVFNVRASYAQEAVATMEYFVSLGVPASEYKNLISFDQNDTFGQAGYNGILAAWEEVNGVTSFPTGSDPTNPIARFRYTRNDDTSVPAQAQAAEAYLATLLTNETGNVPVGIMMTDTYGAGSEFIQLLRQWQFANDSQQTMLMKGARLQLHFSNLSFVGADAMSADLVSYGSVDTGSGTLPYTSDVLISEVVPNYQTDTSTIVQTYNQLIKQSGQTASFTSLEGYIATHIFIQGLLAVNGPITPDTMIPALENLPNLSLGLGATSGFSSTNHQYLDSVWGTTIQPDGTFKNAYYWTVDASTAPLGTFSPFE